jgi:hypothetical protein
LRQVLCVEGSSGSPLLAGRESIQLDPSAGLEIDTFPFMTPLKACLVVPPQDQCVTCLAQMEALAASCRGEFMAGFSLPDCPDFEEWLQAPREILHLHILLVLARLSDCHERCGDYLKSLPFAQRFLGFEHWNEEGLRRVMRLLALSGQRAAALAAYESCCQTLKRELGILPSEETIALEESIRRDEIFPDLHGTRNYVSVDSARQFVIERRQVTVLGQLSAPQAHCKEIINGFSGYMVSIHGGSLLAYFGYPKASENTARQAVRAALAVISTTFSGVELRVAIHTGIVISCGDSSVRGYPMGGPGIPVN